MKWMALGIFAIQLFIAAMLMLTMPAPAQVEGSGPYIDVNRSGFALAWVVTQQGRVVCRSPFVDVKNRRIECD